MYPITSKRKVAIQVVRTLSYRTFTTTYAGELSFIKQRQGTLQRSFVSFPRIGNVHERT